MATFLLAWNQKRWTWENIEEQSQLVKSGKMVADQRSCGSSKRPCKGDRFFLIKLGQEPKGIFASGHIIQEPFEDEHWEKEKALAHEKALFVGIQFDTLLNPNKDNILQRRFLDTEPLKDMHWDTQMSGVCIPAPIAAELEKVWQDFANVHPFFSPEEVTEDEVYAEGAVRRISVNAHERNKDARKRCIDMHGAKCTVCGFDFGKVYGDLGNGFIHVHHLIPISEIGQEYEVNPTEDLRPVCPNCHAMLHRSDDPSNIEQLRTTINLKELQSIVDEMKTTLKHDEGQSI